MLALFSKYIDPASKTRSKLSVHMRPQKIVQPRFSLSAAQAFLISLRTQNIPVDEEKYLELSAGEPPVAAVKAHWEGVLVGGDDGVTGGGADRSADLSSEIASAASSRRTLLDEIDVLAKRYPAVGDEEVDLGADVAFISDPEVFRQGLRLSGPPRPVEEWDNIHLSKY